MTTLVSPELYHQLLLKAEKEWRYTGLTEPARSVFSFCGVPIVASGQFPFVVDCNQCGGTGSGGDDSTYCAKCIGRGKRRFIGMVNANSLQRQYLFDKLPHLFAPSFPVGVVTPAPLKGPV